MNGVLVQQERLYVLAHFFSGHSERDRQRDQQTKPEKLWQISKKYLKAIGSVRLGLLINSANIQARVINQNIEIVIINNGTILV